METPMTKISKKIDEMLPDLKGHDYGHPPIKDADSWLERMGLDWHFEMIDDTHFVLYEVPNEGEGGRTGPSIHFRISAKNPEVIITAERGILDVETLNGDDIPQARHGIKVSV